MLSFDSLLSSLESRLLDGQPIPEETVHTLMQQWDCFKKNYWTALYFLEENANQSIAQ